MILLKGKGDSASNAQVSTGYPAIAGSCRLDF